MRTVVWIDDCSGLVYACKSNDGVQEDLGQVIYRNDSWWYKLAGKDYKNQRFTNKDAAQRALEKNLGVQRIDDELA